MNETEFKTFVEKITVEINTLTELVGKLMRESEDHKKNMQTANDHLHQVNVEISEISTNATKSNNFLTEIQAKIVKLAALQKKDMLDFNHRYNKEIAFLKEKVSNLPKTSTPVIPASKVSAQPTVKKSAPVSKNKPKVKVALNKANKANKAKKTLHKRPIGAFKRNQMLTKLVSRKI